MEPTVTAPPASFSPHRLRHKMSCSNDFGRSNKWDFAASSKKTLQGNITNKLNFWNMVLFHFFQVWSYGMVKTNDASEKWPTCTNLLIKNNRRMSRDWGAKGWTKGSTSSLAGCTLMLKFVHCLIWRTNYCRFGHKHVDDPFWPI